MDRKTQQNGTEKSFIIKGSADQIELARNLISEKIGLEIKLVGGSGNNGSMNSGGYGMQGGGGGGSQNSYPQQWGYPQTWDQNQQQQQNPMQMNAAAGGGGAGQADYSQQWIEYYRLI